MRDAPVVIKPYDPSWPQRFAAASGVLSSTLRPWLAGPVQHIGSTAVPGLAAVHRADRDAYTEAKSEFVQRVLDIRA